MMVAVGVVIVVVATNQGATCELGTRATIVVALHNGVMIANTSVVIWND